MTRNGKKQKKKKLASRFRIMNFDEFSQRFFFLFLPRQKKEKQQEIVCYNSVLSTTDLSWQKIIYNETTKR